MDALLVAATVRTVALGVLLFLGSFVTPVPSAELATNCATTSPTSTYAATRLVGDHGPRRDVVVAQGHAHNDYEHRHPLTDALAHGFTSVEADVWAVDGELLIAHDPNDVDSARTLADLYLDPLAARYAQDPMARPLQLLLDVKGDADQTVPLLRTELARYADMLTSYRGCMRWSGPVTVVLSGNAQPQPPTDHLAYFGYDMPIEWFDETSANTAVAPLVSARWGTFFRWDGDGTMPTAQRQELLALVDGAHATGSKLRLWDIPDDDRAERRAIWPVLARAGVDYISTDHLDAMAAFLRR